MSQPAARTSLSRIGQVALTVRDLDRAVGFYRDTLGLPLLFQTPTMAFFDCAGLRLMLGLSEGAATGQSNSILYFRVDHIEAVHAALAERAVVFRTAPHLVAKLPDREVWMAFFEDTEGNTLALMSEIRSGAED